MTILNCFRKVKQSKNLGTVFNLLAAAVRGQELGEHVHTGKLLRSGIHIDGVRR